MQRGGLVGRAQQGVEELVVGAPGDPGGGQRVVDVALLRQGAVGRVHRVPGDVSVAADVNHGVVGGGVYAVVVVALVATANGRRQGAGREQSGHERARGAEPSSG